VDSLPLLSKATKQRHYPLPKSVRERLCESCFLTLFVAWEHYLESTFQQYLVLGDKYRPYVRLRVRVKDTRTASDLLHAGRAFVGWAECDEVMSRAKIFFQGGEPYASALGNNKVHIERMRTVRNFSVHHSRAARERFGNMVREVYGSGRSITPGGFLLDKPPLSTLPIGTTLTYPSAFRLFADVLVAAAAQIAP
jgi:hypothetical protein